MNKFVRFIQTYLIFGIPFVITCMAWSSYPGSEALKNYNIITKMLWEILAWNLMLWFVVLVLFLIMLVTIPSVREKTLKRLANLNERDEREQYITGKSARAAYISTLSLMIFLLFISVFSLHIYRVPENQAINGKRLTVDIGLGFSFFDKSQVNANSSPNGEVLFDSGDFSPSKPAMILILLCWQLLIFNLTARKEQIKGLR